MMYVFLSRPVAPSVPQSISVPEGNGILVFQSELDYISRCILDRRDIETGGQLFGYWSDDGRPIVMYAIGPGPKANHQKTFFNQDVEYLVKVGRFLKENFGLHHIGEWHSHHQLGLAKPSGHDVNTMISTIREKNLGEFLLCIGNCDHRSSSIKGFLCDSERCVQKEWDVISSVSPVRLQADSLLKGILRHPVTQQASHNDRRLYNDSTETPGYARGYWLQDKGNSAVLKDIMDYLTRVNKGASVKAQINSSGEVVLSVQNGKRSEKVHFPLGFPERAPVVTRSWFAGVVKTSRDIYWNYSRNNITGSFIHFYETI